MTSSFVEGWGAKPPGYLVSIEKPRPDTPACPRRSSLLMYTVAVSMVLTSFFARMLNAFFVSATESNSDPMPPKDAPPKMS
jgi:hypothetical protein